MTPRPLVGTRALAQVMTLVAVSLVALSVLVLTINRPQHSCGSYNAPSSTPPLVADVLRMHEEDVRFCTQESNELGDPFSGRVELRVAVRADGSVEEVTARTVSAVSSTSEIPAHVLTGCLEAAVYSWRFPYTGAPNVLTVPLRVN